MARLVCAWCQIVLQDDYPTELDSHGICEPCYERVIGEPDATSTTRTVQHAGLSRPSNASGQVPDARAAPVAGGSTAE